MPTKSEPPSEKELLTSIDATLKYLLAVTALNYTAGKNQQAAIQSLAAAGLPAKVISEMTGWPTTTVAPVISRAKIKVTDRRKKTTVRAKRAKSDAHKP